MFHHLSHLATLLQKKKILSTCSMIYIANKQDEVMFFSCSIASQFSSIPFFPWLVQCPMSSICFVVIQRPLKNACDSFNASIVLVINHSYLYDVYIFFLAMKTRPKPVFVSITRSGNRDWEREITNTVWPCFSWDLFESTDFVLSKNLKALQGWLSHFVAPNTPGIQEGEHMQKWDNIAST